MSTAKKLLLSSVLFALSVLICSYLSEYVWKLIPCHLCKLQRLPYFFLALTPLMALKICLPIVKTVIICLFSMSLVLSSYHLLVMSGLLKDFCAVPTGHIDVFMDLLEKPIPCAQSGWKCMGIPIAGYNWLASLLFLILLFKDFKNDASFSQKRSSFFIREGLF